MRECVALRFAALICNGFVTSGERYRLERDEGDFVWVVEGELHNPAHLLIVDPIDDRSHEHDFDPVGVQVLNGAQLQVEQVPNISMRIGGVSDPVELKIS